jgi:mono/diheme cytochrome c family protein
MHSHSKCALAALAFAAACGGEKTNGADTAAKTPPSSSTGGAPTTSVADGATLYQRCATCHQANGEGTPGTYPPLAGSEFIKANDPSAAIRVVLHGLQGPVTVRGQTFNGVMPPFGTAVPMSDEEVAAVLSHERSSWGNAAPAVTAEMVARERAATANQQTPWTVDQLKPLVK